MLTIQFPQCPSSSTLDNRILLPGCTKSVGNTSHNSARPDAKPLATQGRQLWMWTIPRMRHDLACWTCWSGHSTAWVLQLILIQREFNRPATLNKHVVCWSFMLWEMQLCIWISKTRSKELASTLALTHGMSLSPTATTSIVSVWQGNR